MFPELQVDGAPLQSRTCQTARQTRRDATAAGCRGHFPLPVALWHQPHATTSQSPVYGAYRAMPYGVITPERGNVAGQ